MKWSLRACGQGKRTGCGDEKVNPGRRGALGPGVLAKRCSPVRRSQRALKAGKAPEFHGRLRAAVLTRVHRGRGGTARLTVREDGTRPQDPLVLHRLVGYCDEAWNQVRDTEIAGNGARPRRERGRIWTNARTSKSKLPILEHPAANLAGLRPQQPLPGSRIPQWLAKQSRWERRED